MRVSTQTNAALKHFATLLEISRKQKKLSIKELGSRLGASFPTIKSLLSGSPTVSVGTYFEAAHILGVQLFEADQGRFTIAISKTKAIEALLPKRVTKKQDRINDDF
ncbi:MAG: helix-turn-helix transcriptional regulator [Alteromonadaceae bacterium]|nr:helix-turn-helix transcriptional regulator [Alteromonadaceae bacterium]